MPTAVKYGKLFMKDANGNLVQIVPESNASISNYTGATSSAAGVAGLVPAATSAQRESFLRGDGTWAEAASPVSEYVGATENTNGTSGLVPAAQSSQKEKFLRGDGTWHNVNFVEPVALSGTAIDLSAGNVFTKTISAYTSFTITGVPQGKSTMFNLVLTNGGAYTVTWPASVKWTAGGPPTLTESGVDVLTFLTADGGTTWYGTMAVQGAA